MRGIECAADVINPTGWVAGQLLGHQNLGLPRTRSGVAPSTTARDTRLEAEAACIAFLVVLATCTNSPSLDCCAILFEGSNSA